jgi:hypothetical protein
LLLAAAVPAGASINTNLSSQGAQAPTDGCSSGTSTLAQANQSQQQVLKLLQDTNSSVETTAPAEQQQTQQLSQANDDPTDTTVPCPSGDDAAGLAKTQQRLSTGKKINSAQDDPAGLSGQFVKPLAQCSYQDKGGVYRTVFGYDAKLKHDVDVPVGPKNILNPKDLKQNQVTTFSDGTHENAFIVSSKDKVQWSLGGQVVTGPVDTECQEHPVPVSGAVVPAVVLTLVAIPLVGWFFLSRKGKKAPKVSA